MTEGNDEPRRVPGCVRVRYRAALHGWSGPPAAALRQCSGDDKLWLPPGWDGRHECQHQVTSWPLSMLLHARNQINIISRRYRLRSALHLGFPAPGVFDMPRGKQPEKDERKDTDWERGVYQPFWEELQQRFYTYFGMDSWSDDCY